MNAIANVIGFDDGPFQGVRVPLLGAVYARERLDGVVTGEITRDGDEATQAIADLVLKSRFAEHIRCVMLQGLTFAGFDVVDLDALHRAVARPVLVVARKAPNLERMNAALEKIEGANERRRRLESAGLMRPLAGVWIQSAGLSEAAAKATLELHTRYGAFPEPLRVAHLLGAAFATGHSHGSA
ncbi:MAG: DUF99 family protein [Myxococcota bacterium]